MVILARRCISFLFVWILRALSAPPAEPFPNGRHNAIAMTAEAEAHYTQRKHFSISRFIAL